MRQIEAIVRRIAAAGERFAITGWREEAGWPASSDPPADSIEPPAAGAKPPDQQSADEPAKLSPPSDDADKIALLGHIEAADA